MGLCLVPTVEAYEITAGIREFYSSRGRNSYSSDAAAKLKMAVTDLGVGSIALHLRLGMMKSDDSSLFLPVFRSDRDAVETMISSIIHGNAVPVLKPEILMDPKLGTPSALIEAHPASARLLLSSYQNVLSGDMAILSLKSVGEFILGSGLGATYTRENANTWKAILSEFRRRASPALKLSLELSNEDALMRLEQFKAEDPALFFDVWKEIDQVRFTLPLAEYLRADQLKIDPESLHRLILDRMTRVHALLPNRSLALSNVILPSCFQYLAQGSEVDCPGMSELKGLGFTLEGERAQLKVLEDFFSVIDQVENEAGQGLSGVEVLFAGTQDEPFEADADPRFPFYNPYARPFLKKKLEKESHHSESIESPPRAYLKEQGDTGPMACIYFDELNAKDSLGAIHARMVENLVGAFPEWRRERRSIRYFEKGDLASCDSVFYLASNFVLEPPAGFFPELAQFSKNHTVTWFNYKFDSFAKDADLSLAFRVPYMIQADSPPTLADPDPGFYRYFEYKGETFEKLAKFDLMTHLYSCSPEIGGVQILDPERVQVLSWARHSKTGAKTPYAIRQDFKTGGSFYYFADLPFSYSHYEDRSLIFSDVIYDILKEKAPDRPPVALVRLEDVNPSIDPAELTWSFDYLANHQVPFSIAMIPYYSNLFENPTIPSNEPVWEPADHFPSFVGMMKYAKARGAQFVVHGLAHQAGDLISGFRGETGSDYEFWSWPANLPHPQDRPDWVMARLELASSVFKRLGIKPIGWEVPHYAGSALDSVIFGRVFEWNYHRGLYFKSEIVQDSGFDSHDRFFECEGAACSRARKQSGQDLRVKADYTTFGSQIFPYPIYRDSYGQALLPESLGMIDFPFYSPGTWRPVSDVDDLLRRAKKLRVIRGAMASFFWHPILLERQNQYYQERPGSYESIGGPRTLIRMVEGLRALGYEFRSIGDCSLFHRRACEGGLE
jgi:uncharacterized protein YdaL